MKLWKNKTLIVAAAGTGGHIFPALAVANYVYEQSAKVHWIGISSSMEEDIVSHTPHTFHSINFSGFLGKGLMQWLTLLWKLFRSFLQCQKILRVLRSNSVLLVMGGYISVPTVLAARFLKIPIILHEQNARAGVGNRFAFYFAGTVCQGFDGAFPKGKKVVTTGNPLRGSIHRLNWSAPTFFDEKRPLKILVFGGSLGAVAFNEIIPRTIQSLLQDGRHIKCLLQCGRGRSESIALQYSDMVASGQLELVDFIDNMMTAYSNTDVVIARSGAITISELTQVQKPAILIPFPYATHDHQSVNASLFQKNGGGWVMQQSNLNVESLTGKIIDLYNNPLLIERAHNTLKQIENNATQQVSKLCLQQLDDTNADVLSNKRI